MNPGTPPLHGQHLTAFTALDWFWTLAFLLLMVGGASLFYRLARRSESDFFLAGRQLPWWLPAWTAIASFVSARIFRRSLAYTQAEWQVLRFHGLGAELLRGWIAGWRVFMDMFILGWVGIAMGKVCEMAFGWPIWVGLVIPTLAVFAILLVSLVGIYAAGGPGEVTLRLGEMGLVKLRSPGGGRREVSSWEALARRS